MKHGYGKDVGQEETPSSRERAEEKWKMGGSEGVRSALVAKIGVLNYTYLHVITRFYTMFLGRNVTRSENSQVGKFCLFRVA